MTFQTLDDLMGLLDEVAADRRRECETRMLLHADSSTTTISTSSISVIACTTPRWASGGSKHGAGWRPCRSGFRLPSPGLFANVCHETKRPRSRSALFGATLGAPVVL